jgi:transmembrane sensor
LFRVDAGSVEIEDLGTVFRVAHEPAGRVRVTVSEGRVAVISVPTRLRVELGAGEERVFSATGEANDVAAPSEAPRPAAATKGPIRGQSRAHGADDPAGLLAAADVARRSHAPREAVAPLRRLVERYPRDPRAPSAAFTLGWVLLTDLNRPREAAVAFAEAERIAPRGALAEDAAARVAEAWQKAGEPRRAAAAARHYAQIYPTGRYIGLMRGLIGEN